ncbi:hypothetical protein JB92DRAFT_2966038 [Gautieria morchelliformis]|nr:hypothetical protein JB92DRAFT_2966038 [Gautieria morchelliformis]
MQRLFLAHVKLAAWHTSVDAENTLHYFDLTHVEVLRIFNRESLSTAKSNSHTKCIQFDFTPTSKSFEYSTVWPQPRRSPSNIQQAVSINGKNISSY